MNRAIDPLQDAFAARPAAVPPAALAILEAARTAAPGVTVIGARELAQIVQARLPELAPKKLRVF